jgi:hypothetical protein
MTDLSSNERKPNGMARFKDEPMGSPLDSSSESKSQLDENSDGVEDVKVELTDSPKKKSKQRKPTAPRQIFDHLPDATPQATSTFQVIDKCIYAIKALGDSEHEGMGCDCVEEWGE